ncbi:MAG: PAS domain S-box protein [Deltaproteobacteria bacterium]
MIVTDGIPFLIAQIDKDERYLFANKAYCEWIGLPVEKITGKTVREIVGEEIYARSTEYIRQVLQGIPGNYERKVRDAKGTEVIQFISFVPQMDKDNQVVSYFALINDITDYKHSQMALLESEKKYRDLVEHANSIILRWTSDGTINFLNEYGLKFFGYSSDEIIGRHVVGTIVPESESTGRNLRPLIDQILANPKQFEHNINENMKRSGEKVWISWTNKAEVNEQGRIIEVLSVGTDITRQKFAEEEREKLQTQLHHSQKMDTVGRLAGGIAHDFNNKLSVILGYAELSKMIDCSNNKQCVNNIEEIIRAARHAQEITSRLLAFSRNNPATPLKLAINVILKDTAKTLGRLIGEHISLQLELQDNLWPVRIDPTQFDQVIMNLTVNSRDAMPQGGNITISTKNVTFDDKFAEAPPGDYVQVSCKDSGCGISTDIVQHVFEPFFTTKESGKGTGLGLASVYGIVKQNNGYVTVESESGKGSVFSVFLPRFADETLSEPQGTPGTKLSGAGTVLLVEDEKPVRDIVQQMLEIIGYHVIVAETPDHAIKLCKQHETVIDCVLSDVIMPDMNGTELKEHINVIRPDLPFIFMSGYTADTIEDQLGLNKDVFFVPKPLNFRQINEILSKLIAAK